METLKKIKEQIALSEQLLQQGNGHQYEYQNEFTPNNNQKSKPHLTSYQTQNTHFNNNEFYSTTNDNEKDCIQVIAKLIESLKSECLVNDLNQIDICIQDCKQAYSEIKHQGYSNSWIKVSLRMIEIFMVLLLQIEKRDSIIAMKKEIDIKKKMIKEVQLENYTVNEIRERINQQKQFDSQVNKIQETNHQFNDNLNQLNTIDQKFTRILQAPKYTTVDNYSLTPRSASPLNSRKQIFHGEYILLSIRQITLMRAVKNFEEHNIFLKILNNGLLVGQTKQINFNLPVFNENFKINLAQNSPANLKLQLFSDDILIETQSINIMEKINDIAIDFLVIPMQIHIHIQVKQYHNQIILNN